MSPAEVKTVMKNRQARLSIEKKTKTLQFLSLWHVNETMHGAYSFGPFCCCT